MYHGVTARFRRRGARRLFVIVVGALLYYSAGIEPDVHALAAAPALGPAITAGAYLWRGYFTQELPPCKHADCWAPQTLPDTVEDPEFVLYILPDHRYQWGTDHGPYVVRAAGSSPMTIILCGRISDGSVLPTGQLNLIAPSASPDAPDAEYVMVPNTNFAKRPPSLDPANGPHSCTNAARFPPADDWRGGLPGMPLWASLQTPGDQRRGVDGVFYVALQSTPSEDDRTLWSCLVTGGYPRVSFLPEGGSQAEGAFIWPDGHFRLVLDGGVTYNWRFMPSTRCPTLRPQDDRGSFYVPPRPVGSTEKLFLACVVAAGGFNDCQAWWLHHP